MQIKQQITSQTHLPITLLEHPYSMNVHFASKVGEKKMSELEVYMYQLINVTYYDVPTQLALLDSLKSEEIVGNTARQKSNNGEYQECHENVLVGSWN